MISEHRPRVLGPLIILATIILVGGIGYFFLLSRVPEPTGDPVCTPDTKTCSDGSTVSRTGPDCTFPPCPDVSDDTRKTMVDEEQHITFTYPETLGLTYTTPNEWPPQVTISEKPFSCTETSGTMDGPDRTRLYSINGRQYCVELQSEGAAGTMYVTSIYTTAWQEGTVSVTVTMRYPQCLNYDNPEQSACTRERADFDLDDLIGGIVSSLVGAGATE